MCVLLDYGSLIVHIFQPETREYYDLDGLWMEAPRLPLEDFGIEAQNLSRKNQKKNLLVGNERHHSARCQRTCKMGRFGF